MHSQRYKHLVDHLAAEIRAGHLRPGTRLPTHRQLAAREGLALVTATRVYAELQTMGLVSGETGRGTFVKEPRLPAEGIDLLASGADTVDMTFNYPSSPGRPTSFAQRCANSQLRATSNRCFAISRMVGASGSGKR